MATNPRLEQLKARPKPAPAAPPAAVAEPPPKPAKAPKHKAAPKPTLTFACGHKEGIDHLERHPCAGCLAKNRRERNARKHEARAAKQSGGAPTDFRFPAGTEGAASWTGEAWRLRLNVPGLPEPLMVEATGIEAAWRAAKAAYLGATNRGGAASCSGSVKPR
jgi:hypothetical protein